MFHKVLYKPCSSPLTARPLQVAVCQAGSASDACPDASSIAAGLQVYVVGAKGPVWHRGFCGCLSHSQPG